MTNSLRILLTNNTLANRAGTELYIRDVARALRNRGHLPIAYSPNLGDVANEIRLAGVPVLDDLTRLEHAPDLIHGQHHLETMTALLRFPTTPAVAFCHGWIPWEETPLRHPRIRRYVAVDQACRDRLIIEHGIEASRVRVILNFADQSRFQPRGPLPAKPARALLFNSMANENVLTPLIRESCAKLQISLDMMGYQAGHVTTRPEDLLPNYDLVFATGRSAIEALTVGSAVIICHVIGMGGLVTSENFDAFRPLNFGFRTMTRPLNAETLAEEIRRYDAADAAKVSKKLRDVADLDTAIDQLEAIYREAVADPTVPDPHAEAIAVTSYFQGLASRVKERETVLWENRTLALANTNLRDELESLRRDSQKIIDHRDELAHHIRRVESDLANMKGSQAQPLDRPSKNLPPREMKGGKGKAILRYFFS